MALKDHMGQGPGDDRLRMAGIVLSAGWLLLTAGFWLFGPEVETDLPGLWRLASIVTVLLPVALIWMAVGLIGAIAGLRAEAAELRLRLGQMREAGALPRQPAGIAPTQPARQAAPVSAPVSARPTAAPVTTQARPSHSTSSPDTGQTSLSFDAPASADADADVDDDDLIRALNFPSGPDDRETIAALRNALRDHDHSRVIRAAQDVVTMMAENGLYMDGLHPAPPQPVLWRRFAQGMRGDAVAAMATMTDPTALELVHAMLKGDEIFRDCAHHFLRHFDLLLTRIGPDLDDDQLVSLAETRSGRAFLLLGRAAHVFG